MESNVNGKVFIIVSKSSLMQQMRRGRLLYINRWKDSKKPPAEAEGFSMKE